MVGFNQDAALRQALTTDGLAAIDAVQTETQQSFDVLLGASEDAALRDRDLQVETTITDLLTAYATRGTQSKTVFLPEVEAINLADTPAAARTAGNSPR